MKYILILSTLFSFNLNSQIEIFSEDFQKGLSSDWKVITKDTNTVNLKVAEYTSAWISSIDPKNALDTVASSTSYFKNPGKAERWLISPQIQLGKFGNYLSWQAKSHDGSFPDDYKVLISTTSPEIDSFNDTVAVILQEGAEWNTYDVNLKSLVIEEKLVYIAFVLNTNDGFKLYLDDIKIRKEDPVSVNELSKSTLTIFPNPTHDFLKVKSEAKINSLYATNLTGQIIELEFDGSSLINTTQLENGVYVLHVQTESEKLTSKFIVSH